MTMNLASQIPNVQASDRMFYPSTSDMNPLPLDAFDLPYNPTQPMTSEPTPEKPVLLPEKEVDPSIAAPMQNAPTATAATVPVQLPDVADDPILESVMRQAQLGLFVTPGYGKS
jgi:hypothetical protein